MATVLITGATGTVMNPLSARLLEEGHTVLALVRPTKGDPQERLLKSLDISEEARNKLVILSGDITWESGGVTREQIGCWQGKIDKFLHGAASIKFEETEDNQVFNTNVYGTENMLQLAEELDIPEFHYISTAYVCGDAKYFTEQDLGETQHHRNAYEKSKAEAERLVRGFSGRFSIYRIPVVTGDSHSGKIKRFSGYYGFFASFWQLFQYLQKKWEEEPKELRIQGVMRDGEGYFHIPLIIPCTTVGPINMVPIDWLTEMFLAFLKVPASGRTFHLTHPRPCSVRETIEVSTVHLGLKGVTCGIPPQENGSKLLSKIQRGIVTNIKLFEPYTSKDREYFDNTTAVQLLGQNWRDPPDIDSMIMGRFIDFAKSVNFGRS